MRRLLVLMVILAFTSGCTESSHNANFLIREFEFKSASGIRDLQLYKHNIYCLLRDGSIILLDEKFKIDSTLTKRFIELKVNSLFASNDTLIFRTELETPKQNWFILSNDLIPHELEKGDYDHRFYEDDKFIISSCCVGEFGGSIFFYEKQTKKTYSYPSTCVTSINKIHDNYFITNSLSHMGGFTEVLEIKNPTKLVELEFDSIKNYCNWWIDLNKENGSM